MKKRKLSSLILGISFAAILVFLPFGIVSLVNILTNYSDMWMTMMIFAFGFSLLAILIIVIMMIYASINLKKAGKK